MTVPGSRPWLTSAGPMTHALLQPSGFGGEEQTLLPATQQPSAKRFQPWRAPETGALPRCCETLAFCVQKGSGCSSCSSLAFRSPEMCSASSIQFRTRRSVNYVNFQGMFQRRAACAYPSAWRSSIARWRGPPRGLRLVEGPLRCATVVQPCFSGGESPPTSLCLPKQQCRQ
jgi:hypothetical protein